MVLRPLGGEVQGDLRVVVGDHLSGGHVHDGRDGDAAGVVGEPGEVGVLDPRDAEHRVDAARIKIEGPAPAVVGGSADPHRDRVLQAEQTADDDRPVRPGAGPRHHQAVATGLDRVAAGPVPGDPVGDVVRVAGELPAAGDVGPEGGSRLARFVAHATILHPVRSLCALGARNRPFTHLCRIFSTFYGGPMDFDPLMALAAFGIGIVVGLTGMGGGR